MLLAAHGVSFGYEPERLVLRDIELTVGRGERVVVLGRSGSGKTTLLLVLAGLLAPLKGRIERRVERSAFVFQASGLLPWLKLADNVKLPLKLMGVGEREQQERARWSLERVGLGSAVDRYPHQVSLGMAKRAELARLLAVGDRCPLWLLDEPFESVDLPTRLQLRQLFLEEAEECQAGVVMITHSREEALQVGNRFAVLVSDGEERATGASTLEVVEREVLEELSEQNLAELFNWGWRENSQKKGETSWRWQPL